MSAEGLPNGLAAAAAPVLAPGRECGTCTACCKVMNFDAPTLAKPAGVQCQHCTGTACGIYEDRPAPCRTFYCLWREVANMPDSLRPDRAGVIFTIEELPTPANPFEKRFVIARAVNGIADFDSPATRQALQVFVEQGDLPVWLSVNQERRLFHPYPALRDAILKPETASPALAEGVALWRKRLGF